MVDFFEILKSRLRQGLLSHFFSNPNAQLYVRELAATLKEDAGNISKELNKLEEIGIFVSSIKGNKKYYSLNRKWPFYKEFKSVMFKTIGIEDSLKEIMNKTGEIVLSYIYGPFAEDTENSDCEVHLLIVGNPDEVMLLKQIEALKRRSQRRINYNIYPESEFRDKIKRGDPNLANILKGPKIMLTVSSDHDISHHISGAHGTTQAADPNP